MHWHIHICMPVSMSRGVQLFLCVSMTFLACWLYHSVQNNGLFRYSSSTSRVSQTSRVTITKLNYYYMHVYSYCFCFHIQCMIKNIKKCFVWKCLCMTVIYFINKCYNTVQNSDCNNRVFVAIWSKTKWGGTVAVFETVGYYLWVVLIELLHWAIKFLLN